MQRGQRAAIAVSGKRYRSAAHEVQTKVEEDDKQKADKAYAPRRRTWGRRQSAAEARALPQVAGVTVRFVTLRTIAERKLGAQVVSAPSRKTSAYTIWQTDTPVR